jgi:ubiquinone biosynthesis protein UbiJ
MLKNDFTLPAPPALSGLLQSLGNEALARITLLINHVIASEPVAMQRLAGQAGKSIRVQWRGWPSFLPAALATRLPQPLPACWTVSAAGLLDFETTLAAPVDLAGAAAPMGGDAWGAGTGAGLGAGSGPGAEAAPDAVGLVVTLDASDLGRWMLAAAGGRPPMEIQGDAALAAEVGWLAENLRWDIEDDLARIVGDAPAHQLARVMRWVVEGARRVAAGTAGLARGTADGLANLRAATSRSNER